MATTPLNEELESPEYLFEKVPLGSEEVQYNEDKPNTEWGMTHAKGTATRNEYTLYNPSRVWLTLSCVAFVALLALGLASWAVRDTQKLDTRDTLTKEDVTKLLESHTAALQVRVPVTVNGETREVSTVEAFTLVGNLLGDLREQVMDIASSTINKKK